MKFIVGDRVIDTRSGGYYVDVRIMSGDADSFDSMEIGPFKEGDDNLSELINLLLRMQAYYPHGRCGGGRENYNVVEGFDDWFEGEWDGDELVKEPIFWQYSELCDDDSWPVDKYDYETHGDPSSFKVFYYADGVKFNVEIVDE